MRVVLPGNNTVCWCRRGAMRQRLNREDKLERLKERKRQWELRVQLRQVRAAVFILYF